MTIHTWWFIDVLPPNDVPHWRCSKCGAEMYHTGRSFAFYVPPCTGIRP
jgi:hypothetical protein